MAIDNSFNVNSAILSGQFGLKRASSGISLASMNIAQRQAQQDVAQNGPLGVLLNSAEQQLTNLRNTLPSSNGSAMDDLLSLQLNARNAQASARVIGTADKTVGRIIDIFS